MSERSRFSYLEIDDLPTSAELADREAARLRQEAQEAEEARIAHAHAIDAEHLRARRAAEAAQAEAEAVERRNAALQARSGLRKAKARSARDRRSAKEQANKAIEKIIGRNYLRDKVATEDAIFDACREAGYEVGDLANTTEHHGNVREVYPLLHLEGGETHYLNISTYEMESGNWEFVAYVS